MSRLVSLLLLILAAHVYADEPQKFSPQQLQDDLSALEAALARTHPDIAHSVAPQTLARAISGLKARLDHSMTRDEAWTEFTALNPVLADGHLAITFPGGAVTEMQRHLQAGGRLFPFNVHIDAQGAIFVRSRLNGDATPLAAARIESLDGRPASEVSAGLLSHMNGDTPAFRAALLSDRFPFWYWKFFGERRTYGMTIAGREIQVEGSGEIPLAYREKSFEQLFRLDLLGDCAVLTIDEFYWRDKRAFYDFARNAFTRIRDAGAKMLIIDIRANSGGDDDVWIEGVMPYIASKPYRNGSTWQLKIIEGRQKDGQKVGDVVRGTQDTLYPPQLDNPLRFKGKVYVLIGARTYSSSVLFANVMQDNDFGIIAGVGGAARSTQSGGIQTVRLPNTQMGVVVPRFVLTRPAGTSGLLEPDVLVVDDPFRPITAVESLIRNQGITQ